MRTAPLFVVILLGNSTASLKSAAQHPTTVAALAIARLFPPLTGAPASQVRVEVIRKCTAGHPVSLDKP